MQNFPGERVEIWSQDGVLLQELLHLNVPLLLQTLLHLQALEIVLLVQEVLLLLLLRSMPSLSHLQTLPLLLLLSLLPMNKTGTPMQRQTPIKLCMTLFPFKRVTHEIAM